MRSTDHDPTPHSDHMREVDSCCPKTASGVRSVSPQTSFASGNGAAWPLPEGHSAQTQGLEMGTMCSCSHMLAPVPA